MLHWIDWLVVVAYVAFALAVGVLLARRAGQDVDEFFLSGRSLPWWVAGTSMVATTFAADTPLVITGWVRDYGIWKNWQWWCLAVSALLTVFLFSRWWRRGGVMTKAEIVELRYPGLEARVLRGTLGVLHATFSNTIALCWVLLAAVKIVDVLFQVDKLAALFVACSIALAYSLLAGFWGVVLTDLLQFAMAMAGAAALAWIAWGAVGGTDGLLAAAADGTLGPQTLAFLPSAGPGGPGDAAFWTTPLAATAVLVGVQWWAFEGVDGSATMVQRISAARDERDGLLAALWYAVAHYALRPWPWIVVALASLVALPHLEVHAPAEGTVVEVRADAVVLAGTADGAAPLAVPLEVDGASREWRPLPRVAAGARVEAGEVLAATDSERAYVAMMARYLPVGLLGLVAASLLAAFMSTIDTHVNLAASFFVNDVYRRFLRPEASARHYVTVARAASVAVLVVAAAFAYSATSIRGLFTFFLSFLGGVGPVYVLRWLWWRVRASTELVAMGASAAATTAITFGADGVAWPLGPLAPGGELSAEGRLLLVVAFSTACWATSLALSPRPDPAALVPFYRRVRPIGAWGPVRALAPDVAPDREVGAALAGVAFGLAAVFGPLLAVGLALVGRTGPAGAAALVGAAGAVGTAWAVARLVRRAA